MRLDRVWHSVGAQDAAQHIHVLREVRFLDEPVGPEGLHEFRFRHDLTGARDQDGQRLDGFARQVDRAAAGEALASARPVRRARTIGWMTEFGHVGGVRGSDRGFRTAVDVLLSVR